MKIGTDDGYWFSYIEEKHELEVYLNERCVGVVRKVGPEDIGDVFSGIVSFERDKANAI